MKVDALHDNLQQFMMHCTVFLSQYLDEYEKIMTDAAAKALLQQQRASKKQAAKKMNGDSSSKTKTTKNGAGDGDDENKQQSNQDEDDDEEDHTVDDDAINAYGHFDYKAFRDCFDARILCYLLTVHNQFVDDKSSPNSKKGKNAKQKRFRWLESEKTVTKNLGLTIDCMKQYQMLYNIVTDDVDKSVKPKLFPIVQSKDLAEIDFESEMNDCNRNIVVSDDIRNAFIRIDGDIINILMGDSEQELENKGLLYSTKRISGLKEVKEFFNKYEWVKDGNIPDGIKPYVYEHRNYMIFQTFIQKYAQSLEGGKVVLRDVIVGKKKDDSKKDEEQEDQQSKKKNYNKSTYKHSRQKGGKKKAGKGQQQIDYRLEAELEVRRKEREAKLQKVDNLIRVCLTMYKDIESRIERLDEELQETNDPVAALPGLSKLHEWATDAAVKCDVERNIYPVVRLWQITFDIFRRFIENVNTDDKSSETDEQSLLDENVLPNIELVQNLQKSLHLMGFAEPAKHIAEIYVDKKQGSVGLSDVLVPFNRESIRISIGTSYARFQMEHCGPYMIRGVGSRPDPRVTGFYPDEWQVKLLDIVDYRYSALVVAPTSSGKTFVSYYCMKEILQQNKSIKNARDKGIVVYVSPTKALTWQACADIYSKYGDVFGVLTPDYDHKPLECQVLVCVPESFEKLLMSPERSQLHRQIKYVIFDEIHCLGRSEGGAIWERLLMLIRSPFLALSATVGHPLRLKKWLNSISNVMQLRTDEYKHKVKIIQHKERWSYLEKYIYLPDKQEQINDPEADLYVGCNREKIGWKSSVIKIHPVGAIGLTQNNNILDVYEGFPPLTFSPADCITLYDSMVKYVDEIVEGDKVETYKQKLFSLKPDLFFKEALYITKNQASAYEKLLKKQLKAWIVGFNKKSQIIDQDIFDIKQGDEDDKDEKLEHSELEKEEMSKSQKKNLSKKERKKLEQEKKKAERERQRKLAEQRRQREIAAKKRHKKAGKQKRDKSPDKSKSKTKGAAEASDDDEDDDDDDDEEEKGEKEEILSIEEKKKRRGVVDKLLNSMANHVLERIDRMEQTFNHSIEAECDVYSFQWVLDNFINLVIELESSDRLPTLCFCLDRVECEQLYLRLLSDLEFLENKKKQSEMGSSNNQEMEIERRRRLKKLQKERKKLEKKKEQAARQKVDADENPKIHDGLEDLDALLDDDMDKTDYRFTLFDRGDEMDSDEMSFWTKRLLKKTKWPPSHPLMKGLERGIGLHHEGLPLQYRHLVETLFRAKMIKLVVSVASLAMGVNMPARCVVFAGDNKELDPLNYRQMMGRAGRRGYDNIGHVIFFGISPRKISYLMTSQLTSLNGHYPILSTTSSIRCTQLLQPAVSNEDNDKDETEYYVGMIRNLFHTPFNYKVSRLKKSSIENKFRYSLELHLQNKFLAAQNLEPIHLGSLVSILHEYEPNNFLFGRILQSGYLHKVCEGYTKLPGDMHSKKKKDILKKLLLILCEIFELHPIPVSYNPSKQVRAKKLDYMARAHLVLPSRSRLEEEIFQIIDEYRANFLSHFMNMYYKQFELEKYQQEITAVYGKENIVNYMEYFLKYFDGGTFGHNQIFLSDFRGRNLRKNAYIYDFYLHEDYKRIVNEASLRDGLAWRMLKRFQLLLSEIKSSLSEISSLKTKQGVADEKVKKEIEEFESGLQKLRQHKFSIYRRQQQFWMDRDGKLWKKHEIEHYKQNLRLQAIGDDFVMAFQDLAKDFGQKFRHIVPIGPISNYGDQQQPVPAAQTQAATTEQAKQATTQQPAASDATTTETAAAK